MPTFASIQTLLAAGLLSVSLSISPVAGGQTAPPAAPGVQTQPRPGPPERPPRDAGPGSEAGAATGVIRGRVVAADSGLALRRALVRLMSGELREGRVTSTDAEGRYELKDLPAGRYTLGVSKGGYVTLQFGQLRPFERGRQLELAEGQALERVDFALPRGGVITGAILDEYGEPVAEASVQALRLQRFGGGQRLIPAARGQTNDIGEYRLFGLPPGEYYVSGGLRAFGAFFGEAEDAVGYAATFYPGTTSPTEAVKVNVPLAQEVANIDFALMPAQMARVTGTATDSSGAPIRRGGVRLVRRGDLVFDTLMGRIRRDGSFIITNVAPGEYLLVVDGGPDGEAASVPVSVGGGDLENLVVRTTPGATLEGRITTEAAAPPDLDLSDTLVAVQRPDPLDTPVMRGSRPAQVREDGTFTLERLVGASLFRIFRPPSGWDLKAVYLNGQDVTDTPVEIAASAGPPPNLEIVLTNRVQEVNGTVRDDRGQPVKEFTALVFADDPERWTPMSRYVQVGRPDQDGRFRIRGLPPGDYLAIAVEYLPEGEWNDPAFLERQRSGAVRLRLSDGETKAVELRLGSSP